MVIKRKYIYIYVSIVDLCQSNLRCAKLLFSRCNNFVIIDLFIKTLLLNVFEFLFERYLERFYFYCRFTFLLQASLLSFPFVHFPSPLFPFIAASLLSLPLRNRTQKRMNLFAFQIAICESFTQPPRRTLRAVRQLPSILLNARLTIYLELLEFSRRRDFEGPVNDTSSLLIF